MPFYLDPWFGILVEPATFQCGMFITLPHRQRSKWDVKNKMKVYVETWGTWTLFGTFETWDPLSVEPSVEPCRTWTSMWNLEPFKSGTSAWNLQEPGSRFSTAAPNHPKALLARPQAFQAVGEKTIAWVSICLVFLTVFLWCLVLFICLWVWCFCLIVCASWIVFWDSVFKRLLICSWFWDLFGDIVLTK